MEEVREVVEFLDGCIASGVSKAYLSIADYELFSKSNEYKYSFRPYRTANPRGKYKRKIVVLTSKQ